jgi:hypothetical protein
MDMAGRLHASAAFSQPVAAAQKSVANNVMPQ